MGLERQEREIDGLTYAVTQLPFGVGQKALIRTIRVAAPAIGAALKGGNGATDVGALLEKLPEVLTEEDVAYFARVFGDASQVQVDGKWMPLVLQNQELHFAGRYLAFFHWIVFSMEVNFSGFFAGMQKGVSGAAPLLAKTAP